MIRITRHALERYQQRVENVSDAEVRQRILAHKPAIEMAIRFGAPVVRNGDGTRFVIQNGAIVTVLGRDMSCSVRAA